MKTVIIAAIIYLAFYALQNLIEMFLDWLRCSIDMRISRKKLDLMKLQDELERAREESEMDSGPVSAIGFEYVPPADEDEEDDDDDDDEEDSYIKRKRRKNK